MTALADFIVVYDADTSERVISFSKSWRIKLRSARVYSRRERNENSCGHIGRATDSVSTAC